MNRNASDSSQEALQQSQLPSGRGVPLSAAHPTSSASPRVPAGDIPRKTAAALPQQALSKGAAPTGQNQPRDFSQPRCSAVILVMRILKHQGGGSFPLPCPARADAATRLPTMMVRAVCSLPPSAMVLESGATHGALHTPGSLSPPWGGPSDGHAWTVLQRRLVKC